MRRFWAFALAMVMLMSNTVSVSAASVTSVAPAGTTVVSDQNNGGGSTPAAAGEEQPGGAGEEGTGLTGETGNTSGTGESGTNESGANESGANESGTNESGTGESGTNESGTNESGTDESGTTGTGTSGDASTEGTGEGTTDEDATGDGSEDEDTTDEDEEASDEEETEDEASEDEEALEGEDVTIERSGSLLKASAAAVKVVLIDDEKYPEGNYPECSYSTLEMAAGQMAADFGSQKGVYECYLLDDVELGANVTFPDFVTELRLLTEAVSEDANAPVYERILDLNGKTLTTRAGVVMNGGVRVTSAAAGKLVLNHVETEDAPYALMITESTSLAYPDGSRIDDGTRRSVLSNVTVTAPEARIGLTGDAEISDKFFMVTSLEAKEVDILGGSWNLSPVSSTNNYVKAERLEIDKAASSLYAEQIIVTGEARICGDLDTAKLTLTGAEVTVSAESTGSAPSVHANTFSATDSRLMIRGNSSVRTNDLILTGTELELYGGDICVANVTLNASELELWGDFYAREKINASASRIHAGKDEAAKYWGNLYAKELTINSAYAGDASGDDTLQNDNGMLIDSLTMKAGTLHNLGCMEVATASVKDMSNEGSFLCDQFTNTGRLVLGEDGIMLINEKGVVNNVHIGMPGDRGDAFLGRSNDGEVSVTFTGTFTAEQETQHLNAFVTDQYRYTVYNAITAAMQADEEWVPEDLFTWISIRDEAADHDAEHLINLEPGERLFTTENKAFQTDYIRVLPDQIKREDDTWIANENNAVYQSGSELLVAGNCIRVCVEHAGGETAGEGKTFADWGAAVSYIDSLNNASAVYKIELTAEYFDIKGAMVLPTKASKVVIRSARGHEETNGKGETEWISEPAALCYQGDITQKTDLVLENLKLVPYQGQGDNKEPYSSTINTGGKNLEFDHTKVYLWEGSVVQNEKPLGAIRGTKTTTVRLLNESRIVVEAALTGIDRIELVNDSALEIRDELSVNSVCSENWEGYDGDGWSYGGESHNWNQLEVSAGNLEVKEVLDMAAATQVICENTMKLNRVSSTCEGNLLSTQNDDSMIIAGDVYSRDDAGIQKTQPYVAVTDGYGTVTGYRKPVDADYTGNGGFVSGVQTIDVPEYAIELRVGSGEVLATAKKVSSAWFITTAGEYYDLTHKEGDQILKGTAGQSGVTLSVQTGEAGNGDRITMPLDQFGTLQEAFDEINKLGNGDAVYVITLNGQDGADKVTLTDVRSSAKDYPVADRAVVSSKGVEKVTDYTFPGAAQQVIIRSDEQQAIVYNQNLTIRSDVTFENVVLYTEKNGTVALGDYRLELNHVVMPLEQDTFTGSGSTKNSCLVVRNCEALTAVSLNKLGEVELADGSALYVAKDSEIGILRTSGTSDKNPKFAVMGKSTVNHITSETKYFHIVTRPKLTQDQKSGAYTRSEPVMTVSGSMTGQIVFTLTDGDTIEDLARGRYVLQPQMEELQSLIAADGAGLAFLKAPQAGTDGIFLNCFEGGCIYKKSGSLVYKKTEPQVTLSYVTGQTEAGRDITATCQFGTYAEAVNEINSMKTKRDYTITFLNGASLEAPVTLTMPKAGTAAALTLTAKEDVREVFFKGDITVTSDVVLRDLSLAQVVTKDKTNYRADDAASMGKYAAPLNIKVNGAYTLDIQGNVSVNNALALNGGGKGTLNIAAGSSLWAAAMTGDVSLKTNEAALQGTIKNFAEVKLYEDAVENLPVVEIVPYQTGSYGGADDKPAELDVTALKLGKAVQLYLGDTSSADENPVVSVLKVKELCAAEKSVLMLNGTAVIKDAILKDEAELMVSGQTFQITGTLTAEGEPVLGAALDQRSPGSSVLQISGKVVQRSPESKVVVAVMTDRNGIKDLTKDKDRQDESKLYLGGYYYNTKGEKVPISNKLLTAPKADASSFAAYAAYLDPDHKLSYGSEDSEPGHGYILCKSGKDIVARYGSEVEAALYTFEEGREGISEQKLYDYYTSFNEAVAAIDARKAADEDYCIELLQDVGGANAAEKVNLPAKASTVEITSKNGKGIYYSNDLTLGCNTVFDSIGLYPAGTPGKEKGINVRGYGLTLKNLTPAEGAERVTIGKLTGTGKTDCVYLKTTKLDISGDVTKLAGLYLCTADPDQKADVRIKGRVSVTELNYIGEVNNPAGIDLTIVGTGSSITRLACDNLLSASLSYPDLNITGEIEANVDIDFHCTAEISPATFDPEGVRLNLTAAGRLLTVKCAELKNISFYAKDSSGQEVQQDAQWADGAVYAVQSGVNQSAVNVGAGSYDNIVLTCVDLTQAAAYINARADRNANYYLELQSAGGGAPYTVDTCVTDQTSCSKLTLPAKDKMSCTKIDGYGNKLAFTGDVTVNGHVALEDIVLANEKDFSFTCVKDSDGKKDGTVGKSELELCCVQVQTTTDSKGKTAGRIKNITGVKGVTALKINQTVRDVFASDYVLELTGGITKIAQLTLTRSTHVTTKGVSEVEKVIFKSDAEWTGLGKTTIGEVELNGNSAVMGTTLVKEVPQLTITGNMSGTWMQKVLIKLYEYDAKTDTATPYDQTLEKYQDQPLVIAKKASADWFVADGCKDDSGSYVSLQNGIEAYKDAKGYVYNGDVSGMEVRLIDASGSESYVRTYAEAIAIINSIGNKDGRYTIDLCSKDGVVKTALDKQGKATYGALALPKAGAADCLWIAGRNESQTIQYTGAIQPAGDLELAFMNLVLAEGKVNARTGSFEESDGITLNLGSASVNFWSGVSTPDAAAVAGRYVTPELEELYANVDPGSTESAASGIDLVFSKITTKSGSMSLQLEHAFVIGDAAVTDLELSYDSALDALGRITVGNVKEGSGSNYLVSKSAITIGSVSAWNNGSLGIVTSYTKKELSKAASQLTITGEAASNVTLRVYQHCYDTKANKYRLLTEEETKQLLWKPEGKTSAYQKLINAPKLQTENLFIYCNMADIKKYLSSNMEHQYKQQYQFVKLDGTVYLTKERLAIWVKGYDGSDMVYNGSFYSWEQAVKEIDRLDHPERDYIIVLEQDLGTNGAPIKNLTMPAKAATVEISSDNDAYGILMTGTKLTLKTDTYIGVDIVAVKKSGSRYYSVPYTIDTGKNLLILFEMWTDGEGYEGMGYLEPQLRLTGAASGKAYIGLKNDPRTTDGLYQNHILQISNIGTVTVLCLEQGNDTFRQCDFAVRDGVSGVGTLILEPATSLTCTDKDIKVKNMILGLKAPDYEDGDENGEFTHPAGQYTTRIHAPNITVSDTLTMAGAELRAGMTTGSDGKVTLKDVVAWDYDNDIFGKQDKNGKTQIKISGTVTTGEGIEALPVLAPPVTLGLCYHNSTNRWVQLSEDLVLANAPKADLTMLRAHYAEYSLEDPEKLEAMNMGFGKNGYGLYRRGSDIVYGKLVSPGQ